MKALLFLIFILQIACANLIAQHANIVIGNSNDPEEPSIAINPKNTLQLVAGANIDIYYISNDGGYNWQEGTLSSIFGVYGDPAIAVDTTGAFYFFHLSNPSSGNWIDRIVCQKLDSLSGNWTDGSFAGLNGTKAQDKHWPVVDRTNNTIYITWSQFDEYGSSNSADSSNILFSKSTDGGQSWTPALRINKTAGNCIDSDSTVEGAVPAVGPNGEVYVSWAGPEGLLFDKSIDGGTTWLQDDIFVSNIGGGWDYSIPGIMRANGLPVTACDLSNSPHNGTIYINWSDQTNGAQNTDIWLSQSTDGGNNWSAPIRVNDDTTNHHQFFTWMTIDQTTGYLWFVWYDRRNYSDDRTDVYMACSKDGGQTFINFRVSESPFLPNSSVFFGDYTNVTAHNSVVRPIWTRLESFQLSVLTAIIDTSMLTSVPQFSVPEEEFGVFPNPSNGDFCLAFKMHTQTPISIKLTDISGATIAILAEGESNIGRQQYFFNAADYNLQSGVYFIVLNSNEKNIQKKWILTQ